MNIFDTESLLKLQRCEKALAGVLVTAREHCPFAFKVVQSDRTIAQQREYFKAGASRVNPDVYRDPQALYQAAKHIVGPGMPLSRAVDIAIVGKEPYNIPSLAYVAGLVRMAAEQQGVRIRWGGDFDQDGILLEPGTFQDLPHFELA